MQGCLEAWVCVFRRGCQHLGRVVDAYRRGGETLARDLGAVLGLQGPTPPDR